MLDKGCHLSGLRHSSGVSIITAHLPEMHDNCKWHGRIFDSLTCAACCGHTDHCILHQYQCLTWQKFVFEPAREKISHLLWIYAHLTSEKECWKFVVPQVTRTGRHFAGQNLMWAFANCSVHLQSSKQDRKDVELTLFEDDPCPWKEVSFLDSWTSERPLEI